MAPHRRLALVCVLLVWWPAAAFAQDTARAAPAQLDRALRVFIDCRAGGCDEQFFRTELTWFDHVRDQQDADVHVLVTGQGTGGGGTEYTEDVAAAAQRYLDPAKMTTLIVGDLDKIVGSLPGLDLGQPQVLTIDP